MKTSSYIIAGAVALAAAVITPSTVSATSPATPQTIPATVMASRTDSLARATRIHNLKLRKESLEKDIRTEDRKRNRQIAGVSPETLEEMNNRQDSICLALRSQLVDVTLELKELTPTVQSPVLVNQVNQMLNVQGTQQPARQPAQNGGRKPAGQRPSGRK